MRPGARHIAATLVVLTTAACAPQSEGVTLLTTVGPGETRPDAETTLALFQEVCIETRARHAAMADVFDRLPVVRDPDTDIFYHTGFDTSFKAVFDEGVEACSFVSGVSGDPRRITRQMGARAKAADLPVGVRSDRSEAGVPYVVGRTFSNRGR